MFLHVTLWTNILPPAFWSPAADSSGHQRVTQEARQCFCKADLKRAEGWVTFGPQWDTRHGWMPTISRWWISAKVGCRPSAAGGYPPWSDADHQPLVTR